MRFRNVASSRVRVVTIQSMLVADVLDACKQLFLLLERSEASHADLIRMLWAFRASVLFALLPFDDPELGLLAKLEGVTSLGTTVPHVIQATKRLDHLVRKLLAHPENPKAKWILDGALDAGRGGEGPTGVFCMMAMGRTFGISKVPGALFSDDCDCILIDSKRVLEASVFDRLIIIGSTHYLSATLFTQIFYEGRARSFDVLVYPGEYFYLRSRLRLPESYIFRGRLVASRVFLSSEASTEVQTEVEDQDMDKSMMNALWSVIHDGAAAAAPGLSSARYLLCRDGHGLFVPTKTEFLVWRGSKCGLASEIHSVPVENIAEGDWLIMQPTETGYLLDLESAEAGFGKKLEEACDWRPALERLLLTATPEEIAKEMSHKGAHGTSLPQSLRNWSEGSVYGPGDRHEFRMLLETLVEHRKLPNPEDFEAYVTEHWKSLQEIRGIRHKAGVQVKKEIHHQLMMALENLNDSNERQTLQLENGVRIHLSQVAAVDERASWVPASRLMHMQPMKGSRWHE